MTQNECLLHHILNKPFKPSQTLLSWSWDGQATGHTAYCLYVLTYEAGLMLQLPSQQKARAARTPRGGRSTPRHVTDRARPAQAPRRVCFSPCTPDVQDHSHAPAAALDPPRRAAHAQKGTPRSVPPLAGSAAAKTSVTSRSALKVNALKVKYIERQNCNCTSAMHLDRL